MAKAVKYETIEQVVQATGIELTEKTRPFLESFVKKEAGTAATASAKKKQLLEQAEFFGVTGLKADEENVTGLLIKIATHLFNEGRVDEMKEFATANNIYVTDTGAIHRLRQSVKPIEQRNAGVKEGSVGYNTILLLKNPEYAGLTAAELAQKQAEVYGQTTTAACIQWYINYCNKKKQAAIDAGEDAAAFEIIPRTRAAKSTKAAETGVILGAELTLEKASKPRGFQKKDKAAAGAELGENLELENS